MRLAKPEDALKFAEWSLANPHSGFDPEVPAYPSTVTLCAYDEHGPLAFLPLQQPLFLESLAPRPGATAAEIARALRELTQQAVTLANATGARELYFLGTEDGTNRLAENQLFERMPWPVYRLRLRDLEDAHE